jgi:hypothetical protein
MGIMTGRTVSVNELNSIKEYSLVVRFEDENGNQYPVGSSPLDNNDTSLIHEQVFLDAEAPFQL